MDSFGCFEDMTTGIWAVGGADWSATLEFSLAFLTDISVLCSLAGFKIVDYWVANDSIIVVTLMVPWVNTVRCLFLDRTGVGNNAWLPARNDFPSSTGLR